MVFDWTNIGTPFSWYFVAALFIGAAVARVLSYQRTRGRWALVYLYLSISVAAASAGILVPGTERFLDLRLAYFTAGVFAVSLLAFRHKVVFGMPVLLIAVASVTILGVTLREWQPVTGHGAEVARVQVLAKGPDRVDIETEALKGGRAGSAVSGTLPSGAIVPVVTVLQFSPYYFFIASPLLCRFEGLTTTTGESNHVDLRIPQSGSAGTSFAARLPGVRRREIVGEPANPISLQRYLVRLTPRLGARLAVAPP